MSAASPMTAQTIIEKLCRDHVHRPQAEGSPAGIGTADQPGRSRVVLRRAWGVFNKWALEILRERGTIDVPNFVRVGWQRFRRLDGQVRFYVYSCRLRQPTTDRIDCAALRRNTCSHVQCMLLASSKYQVSYVHKMHRCPLLCLLLRCSLLLLLYVHCCCTSRPFDRSLPAGIMTSGTEIIRAVYAPTVQSVLL